MQSSLLLAVAALASGQWIQPRIFDQPNLRSGNARELATYLEFAPAAGAGLPVAENLCDALAAEVPNWSTPVDGGAGNWCLGGDGQEVAGSEVDFEPFGSPTPVSVTVCPSGPDCTTKSALQTGVNQGSAATAAVASGSGPMTACWWGQVNAGTGDRILLGHASAFTVAGVSWQMDEYLGTLYAYFSDGAGFKSTTVATAPFGAPTLFCTAHSPAGAAHLWKDGVAAPDSAAFTRNSSTAKPSVNSINAASYYADQNHLGSFYVDQELSAATIAAIARRVLADQPKALIRGSPSLALTYTRTGSMFCSKADNTGSTLPANRPCISQNGILVEAAGTNLALRSQELDNAAWLKNGSPVTANYGLAPDGTKTAERFTVTAGGNQFAYAAKTGTAGANTFSVFVKSISGALTFPVCAYNGGTAYTCSSCAISTDSWTRCTHTVTATTDWRYLIGDYYIDNLARDVIVWGAQSEAGSVATSYIPTTSAAATRGATITYLTHGQSTYSTGCIAGTRASSVAMDQYANNGLISTEDGTGGSFQQTILSSSGLKGYVGQAVKATGTLPSAAGTDRLILRWDGSGTTLDTNGTLTTGAAGTPAATTILRIGNYGGGATEVWPGRYSAVQLDTRFSRCR